ncbi:MAG: hemerythrin domain-containing protein [Planctomycetes bacterium]|nr:hemerythrin domain-containing protein [Planctomycetota bacterium]
MSGVGNLPAAGQFLTVDMPGPLAQRQFRMPRFTDILRAEHGAVRRAMRILRAIAGHVQNGGELPQGDTAILLRFLREFVLAIHFRKENEVVWPALTMHGDERCAGLIGELLRVQDEVVELVHSLVLFWEPTGDLTTDERLGFVDSVGALGSRMQRMLEIEECSLFGACDSTVPADDQMDWGITFAQFETGRTGRDTWIVRLAGVERRWAS